MTSTTAMTAIEEMIAARKNVRKYRPAREAGFCLILRESILGPGVSMKSPSDIAVRNFTVKCERSPF